MDHNICLGINGKCQIVTYVNGKPDWSTIKPGIHGDHNIIDGRGASGMFVNFNPGKFIYDVRPRPGAPAMGAGNSAEAPSVSFDPSNYNHDLRLRSGAPAIGAGNPVEAPPVDITGAPRGSRVDIGAYQYIPPK
jgi:hypothetical protein